MRRVSVAVGGWAILAVLATGLGPRAASRARPTAAGTLATPLAPLEIPERAVSYEHVLSITDADRLGDRWYLLDRSASRVRVIGPGGEKGPTFDPREAARDLTRPAVVVAHGDTVVVADRLSGSFRLFDAIGRPLGERRLRVGGCRVPLVSDAVSTPAGLVFLVTCPDVRLNTKAFAVLEVPGGDGRVLAAAAARMSPSRGLDPHFTPVLATHREGIVFGTAGSECLPVVDPSGVRTDSLCVRWLAPLPLSDPEQAAVRSLKLRAAPFGARVEMPEALPRFEALFAIGEHGYAFRTYTPLRGGARRMSLGSDRRPAGIALPQAHFAFGAPGSVLLGWEAPDGVWVALYDLPP